MSRKSAPPRWRLPRPKRRKPCASRAFAGAPKRTRTSTRLSRTRPSTWSPGCQMRPDRAAASVPSAIPDDLDASDDLDVATNVARPRPSPTTEVRAPARSPHHARIPPAKRKPGIERMSRLHVVPSGRELRAGGDARTVERSRRQVPAPRVGRCSDSSISVSRGRSNGCGRTAASPKAGAPPCAALHRPGRASEPERGEARLRARKEERAGGVGDDRRRARVAQECLDEGLPAAH